MYELDFLFRRVKMCIIILFVMMTSNGCPDSGEVSQTAPRNPALGKQTSASVDDSSDESLQVEDEASFSQIVDLMIEPDKILLAEGETTEILAFGVNTSGGLSDVSSSVDWTISDTQGAEIIFDGSRVYLKGSTAGTYWLTAFYSNISKDSQIGIFNRDIKDIEVFPVNFQLGIDQPLQIRAHFGDGTISNAV